MTSPDSAAIIEAARPVIRKAWQGSQDLVATREHACRLLDLAEALLAENAELKSTIEPSPDDIAEAELNAAREERRIDDIISDAYERGHADGYETGIRDGREP